MIDENLDETIVDTTDSQLEVIKDEGEQRLEASNPSQPISEERSAGSNTGLAWLTALIIATGGIAAFFSESGKRQDAEDVQAQTQVQLVERSGEVDNLKAEIEQLKSKTKDLIDNNAELQAEAMLAEAAFKAIKETQDELESRLQEEVKKGNVLISNIGGELVVDLLDKVVFDSGIAELNETGQKVLREVGETLAKVPNKVISVAGHTDNLPMSDKLIEKLPSNWELSTLRATNVVRFLQDEVKIPGNRLSITGYGEYRPIASNNRTSGRRKNRRIEVRLLPLPAKR